MRSIFVRFTSVLALTAVTSTQPGCSPSPSKNFSCVPETASPADYTVPVLFSQASEFTFCAQTADVFPPAGPIDVVFLFDSTGSMQLAINQVRNSVIDIASRFATLSDDVQMGVADYRDFNSVMFPLGGGSTNDFPYRVLQPLTTDAAAIHSAIAGIVASAGGDVPETATEALYQAATGAGLTYMSSTVIAPSSLGWRTSSSKIIILITDAVFKTLPLASYGIGHSQAAAEAALTAAGIHVMGIAVEPMAGGYPQLAQMETLATNTDAIARSAIDLNGDGDSSDPCEFLPDDPIVYQTTANGTPTCSSQNIAQTIAAGVAQITSFDVIIDVKDDPLHVIQSITPGHISNLSTGEDVCFSVTIENSVLQAVCIEYQIEFAIKDQTDQELKNFKVALKSQSQE